MATNCDPAADDNGQRPTQKKHANSIQESSWQQCDEAYLALAKKQEQDVTMMPESTSPHDIWIWHTDDSCSQLVSGDGQDDACPLCAFDVWFINQFGLRPGPGPGPSTTKRHRNFLQMNNFCGQKKGKVKKQSQPWVHIFVA